MTYIKKRFNFIMLFRLLNGNPPLLNIIYSPMAILNFNRTLTSCYLKNKN